MLADWLASLMSVDKTTVFVLASMCGIGTWLLRGQLSNPIYGFAVQPLLTLLTVFIYALLQASGLIEPMIVTDWIKGLLVSAIVGHGIGLAIGMSVLLALGNKAEAVETELIKRQAKNAPPQRAVRRNFRESLK